MMRQLALFAVLAAVIAAPLALPAVELVRHPGAWSALGEVERISSLAFNSLLLAIGAVALAVPSGTLAALLMERGGLPGVRFLRAVVALGLFVPLSVSAAAWQAAFGAVGLPDAGDWRPWRIGLLPALWV